MATWSLSPEIQIKEKKDFFQLSAKKVAEVPSVKKFILVQTQMDTKGIFHYLRLLRNLLDGVQPFGQK